RLPDAEMDGGKMLPEAAVANEGSYLVSQRTTHGQMSVLFVHPSDAEWTKAVSMGNWHDRPESYSANVNRGFMIDGISISVYHAVTDVPRAEGTVDSPKDHHRRSAYRIFPSHP